MQTHPRRELVLTNAKGATSSRVRVQDWPWDLTDWTVRNSHRHDVSVKIVPGAPRARTELNRVLPASERRLARWNGNPWVPDGGGEGQEEDDGAAWSLAYWIGVYHGYLTNGE